MKKKDGRFGYSLIRINLPFKGYVITSLVLSAILILVVSLLRGNLPPYVPLYYGLAVGEEQLAQQWALIIPSLVSVFIIFLNISLSYIVKNDFLKRTLIISGVVSSFFSLITTVKIILLVGSF